MVEMDGLFYWTGSWTEEANGMMRYVLDLAAPTSFVKLNDSITALWSRTPSVTRPYMKENIRSSMEQPQYFEELPNLGTYRDEGNYPVFWVQQSGRDSNGKQKCVGFFALLFPGTTTSAGDMQSMGGKTYPRLQVFLSDIAAFSGILAEDTDDLSISVRAPFRYRQSSDRLQTGRVNLSGNDVEPTIEVVRPGGGSVWLYDVQELSTVGRYYEVVMTSGTESDGLWESNGRVWIRDCHGASLMEVPTWGIAQARCYVVTRMDRSGIYTEISSQDHDGDTLQTISYTEGKLPFTGNTWETYKAYQMEGDRQQATNTVMFNNRQAEIDKKVGIANATIDALFTTAIAASNSSIWDLGSGAAVGAAAGVAQGALGTYISIWESEHVRDLKNDQAAADFELAKTRAIMQPQVAYQPGYGTVYTWMHHNSPLTMVYSRPDGVTEEYNTEWHDAFGWASEGKLTISAIAGFYQGKLMARSDVTGVYFDELNGDFARGFRFKVLQ